MLRNPTRSTGFAPPAQDTAHHDSPLPALIATLALVFSIAVVLTAVSMSAARAAPLF